MGLADGRAVAVGYSMPATPETFTTARLTGRRPTLADAPGAYAAYASDPEVTRYLSWHTHLTVETTRAFLVQCLDNWASGEGHRSWMLCERGSDTPVGSIGFTRDGGRVLVGYVLARPLWGRGLMTEALRWLIGWSLTQTGVQRVWAYCDAENPASARVMEKAGMVREGVLRRWHVCPNIGPELRDCIVCARVR